MHTHTRGDGDGINPTAALFIGTYLPEILWRVQFKQIQTISNYMLK